MTRLHSAPRPNVVLAQLATSIARCGYTIGSIRRSDTYVVPLSDYLKQLACTAGLSGGYG